MEIWDGDLCTNCGIALYWWKIEKKKKVYVDNAMDMYCSKKCFKEYQKRQTLKEVIEIRRNV